MPFDKHHLKWNPSDVSTRDFYDSLNKHGEDNTFNSYVESIKLIRELMSASASIFSGLLDDCEQIQDRINKCNVRIRIMATNESTTTATASSSSSSSSSSVLHKPPPIIATTVNGNGSGGGSHDLNTIESALLERQTAPKCVIDLYNSKGIYKIPTIKYMDRFKPYMKDTIAKTDISLTTMYSNPMFFFESWSKQEDGKLEKEENKRNLKRAASAKKNQSIAKGSIFRRKEKEGKVVLFSEPLAQTRKKINAKLALAKLKARGQSGSASVSYSTLTSPPPGDGRQRRRTSIIGMNFTTDSASGGGGANPRDRSATLMVRRSEDDDDFSSRSGIVKNIEKSKVKRNSMTSSSGISKLSTTPDCSPPDSPTGTPPDSPSDSGSKYLNPRFIKHSYTPTGTPTGTPPDSPPPSDDESPSSSPDHSVSSIKNPPPGLPKHGGAISPISKSTFSTSTSSSVEGNVSHQKFNPPSPPSPPVAANPLFEKYEKMKKILPEAPLRHKMLADGLSEADCNQFFGTASQQIVLRSPPPPPPPPSTTVKVAALDTNDESSSNSSSSGSAKKKPNAPPPPPPPISPKSSLNSTATAESAPLHPSAPVNPLYEKYEKMKKILPEGAIRHKMLADGLTDTEIDAFYGVTPAAGTSSSSKSGSGSGKAPPPPPKKPNSNSNVDEGSNNNNNSSSGKSPPPPPPPSSGKAPKLSLMDSIKAGSTALKSVTPNQDKKPTAENTMLSAIRAGAKLKHIADDFKSSTKDNAAAGDASKNGGKLFDSKEVSAILARRKFLQNTEETSSSDDGEWS